MGLPMSHIWDLAYQHYEPYLGHIPYLGQPINSMIGCPIRHQVHK